MPTELVTPEIRNQLIKTARTTVGDRLRSLTYFRRDDFEQLYLREDLEPDADLQTFIENEWDDFANTQTAYDGSELGPYQYTIRAFENGFLIRIATENGALFATTDGVTMRDYEELVTAVEAVAGEG